ncbi:hypothetical protein BC831DRAFT_460412 [Entophlyctis helioformis]|nr:hypothetical protein BC831DRAFT_460412 [Entophlyctis helioformis]
MISLQQSLRLAQTSLVSASSALAGSMSVARLLAGTAGAVGAAGAQQHQQVRWYKKHMNESLSYSSGRTVVVKGSASPTVAYFRLRAVLEEANFRSLVKSQERFESNPDKRRRRRKEKDWAVYMAELRRQSRLAVDLRDRHKTEMANYKDI